VAVFRHGALLRGGDVRRNLLDALEGDVRGVRWDRVPVARRDERRLATYAAAAGHGVAAVDVALQAALITAPQFEQHSTGFSSAVLPTSTARASAAVSGWTRSSMMCRVRYR